MSPEEQARAVVADAIRAVADAIHDAVALEREACAKLAEEKEPLGGCGEVAAAIRARGK